MYAAQKYSANDRVTTSREWARKFPNRVPIILSSPHWAFYAFKCMLVPNDMTVRELCATVHAQWKHKFPDETTHILLKIAAGSPSQGGSDPAPLNPTRTCDDLARTYLAPDGFLYVTAHLMT